MKIVQLLLPAAILLLSSHAFAGEFQISPVKIDLDNQEAQGSLLAARFSKNEEERIGCAVGNGVLSPGLPDNHHYAYCEASLGNGVDALCITYDAAMINTIASINTLSFVYFKWEYRSGQPLCTHVTVATRSRHIPEKLKP
jgi:hypothetical protein